MAWPRQIASALATSCEAMDQRSSCRPSSYSRCEVLPHTPCPKSQANRCERAGIERDVDLCPAVDFAHGDLARSSGLPSISAVTVSSVIPASLILTARSPAVLLRTVVPRARSVDCRIHCSAARAADAFRIAAATSVSCASNTLWSETIFSGRLSNRGKRDFARVPVGEHPRRAFANDLPLLHPPSRDRDVGSMQHG